MSNNSKNNQKRHANASQKSNNNAASASKRQTNSINTKPKNQNNNQTKTETIKQTKTETIKPVQVSKVNSEQKSSQQTDKKQTEVRTDRVTSNKDVSFAKNASKKVKKGLAALFIIGATLIVGLIATLIGGKLKEGYIKPPAYAPDWLFPIVWTIIYISIGIAAYLAYIAVSDKKKQTEDLICYAVHLFFNMLWPLFYFRLNLLVFSSIWLGLTIITAIIVTYRYYKAYLASGIIFTIYTMWLLYALYLNLGITMLNF